MTLNVPRLFADTNHFLTPLYLENLFRVRIQVLGKAVGSYYPNVLRQGLEKKFLGAEWRRYEGHPHDVCLQHDAWQADVPGIDGILPLEEVADDKPIYLMDTRGLGFVQPVVQGISGVGVPYTTLITFRKQGVALLATFHPGRPIIQPRIPVDKKWVGKQMSTGALIDMGFKWAQASKHPHLAEPATAVASVAA